MSIQLTLAWRYLWGRKLRTTLTTLAVIFGVLVIFAMNIMLPSMLEAFGANMLAASDHVDLTVTHRTGGAFSTSVVDQVKAVDGVRVVTGWLGLPPQASAAFLMGFLRRDFGATGLFVMQSQGLLTPVQVVVAMVTITLFIPCIASVMMIAKERGGRTALGMFVLIIPLALLVGGILYRMLLFTGWGV